MGARHSSRRTSACPLWARGSPGVRLGAMARRFQPEALLPIEVELLKERAWALKAVGERIEKLLAALSLLEASLTQRHGADRVPLIEEHRKLRAQAEAERWKLIVQREAMGLSRHDEVDRVYPLPPAISG